MTLAIADYRTRIRLELRDAGQVAWDNDQIDEALRNALSEYSQVSPCQAIGTVTLAADGWEFSVSTLAPIDVQKVWLPYTAADPEDPPEWRTDFELWPGNILRINDGDEPDATDVARIWYTKAQTVNGLDSATATTIPDHHADIVIIGAAAHAASGRTRQLAESQTPMTAQEQRIAAYAFNKFNYFRARLNQLRQDADGGFVTLKPVRRYRVPRE